MELKLHAVTDFLNEQSWFQELKGKWEELDPQSRGYLKIAGLAAAVLLFLYLILSSVWGIHKLKRELSDKTDLLTMIESSTDEMRRLRETGGPLPPPPTSTWPVYFENEAARAGIDKSLLSVLNEKAVPGGTVAKESLFDLQLKKTTLRQVVKLAYFLENDPQPVKVRSLSIDTNPDLSGYLDATIAVSAFTSNEGKK